MQVHMSDLVPPTADVLRFFCFLMGSMGTARCAELLQFYFALNFSDILPGPVIIALALGAGKTNKIWLRHNKTQLKIKSET